MCDLTTDLPFDIRDYRSVFFDPMDPDRHDRTIDELKSAAHALVGDDRPMSPVSRAIGRPEILTKQDAKQASLDQLFADVDDLKRQVRQLGPPRWRDFAKSTSGGLPDTLSLSRDVARLTVQNAPDLADIRVSGNTVFLDFKADTDPLSIKKAQEYLKDLGFEVVIDIV